MSLEYLRDMSRRVLSQRILAQHSYDIAMSEYKIACCNQDKAKEQELRLHLHTIFDTILDCEWQHEDVSARILKAINNG